MKIKSIELRIIGIGGWGGGGREGLSGTNIAKKNQVALEGTAQTLLSNL